ncbi:MAG: hypothetical protein WBV06_06945 [Acidimicrobiia bacterium]
MSSALAPGAAEERWVDQDEALDQIRLRQSRQQRNEATYRIAYQRHRLHGEGLDEVGDKRFVALHSGLAAVGRVKPKPIRSTARTPVSFGQRRHDRLPTQI